MNRLITTPFFTLVKKCSEQPNSHIGIEYYNFAQSVYLLCQDTSNPLQAFFTLNYTVIELRALMGNNDYVTKAVDLIDAALKWQQEHNRQSSSITVATPPQHSFVWTTKTVYLVEMAYAFAEMRCVNNGDIGIAELIDYIATTFGVQIKDCFGAYCDIKRRKGDSRTYFLDQLRERLNDRMTRDDEGVFK